MYGYETFHEKLMLDLINAVRTQQSRHAYIFKGEEGLAVYSSARLFAAALTCKSDSPPCGTCHICHLSEANTNPDIITVESSKKSIGVDEIREITSDAYIKPFDSKKKVYIIRNADIMTPSAQNAFLKTLEEPPEFAVFILLANDEENLLQTVRSRCITVRFSRVSDSIVRQYIEKKYPECDNKDFLVKYASGVPMSIDSVVGDKSFTQLRNDSFDMLARVMSQRKLDAYDAADFLEKNKDNAGLVLELWINFVRDIILIQHDCEKLVVNTDFMARLTRASNSIDEAKAVHSQELLIKAVKMQKRYVNTRALALWLALGI